MPGPRLKVVVTRRLPEPVETRMRELFDVTLNEDDRPMDPAGLAAAVKTADVLVPGVVIGQAIDNNIVDIKITFLFKHRFDCLIDEFCLVI